MDKREEILKQLGNSLGNFYNSAPRGSATLRLEYFIIKNSKIILENNILPKDLLSAAKLNKKKITSEINRSLKLSAYVKIIKEL